jgi:hypothetical protein
LCNWLWLSLISVDDVQAALALCALSILHAAVGIAPSHEFISNDWRRLRGASGNVCP